MEIKEVIGKVKNLNEILCEETISDIVSALKQGEKYEAMYKKLKGQIYTKGGCGISATIDKLEQRSFPQPKSKLIKLLAELDKLVKEVLKELGG